MAWTLGCRCSLDSYLVEKMAPSRCSDLARVETRAPLRRSGLARAAMTGPRRCSDHTKADCSDLC